MRVTVVLPTSALDAGAVGRGLDWIKARFTPQSFRIMAPEASLPHYRRIWTAPPPIPYARESALESDILVYVKGAENPDLADNPSVLSGPRLYTLEKDGRLRLVAEKIDAAESPTLGRHVFNRVGPKSPDGEFYYFPYGYLFKYTGLGPINEFGYRIDGDFMRFADREPDHKLIVVFGGSAAWSMYSLHNEMFATRLEEKLNDWCKRQRRPERFTVLNFGMHGHVVLNEMLAHMLFVSRINPDIVIAHDGFNDLVYGMLSDPDLLARHDITYQYNLEGWSQLLHDTRDVPNNQPETPLSVHNIPQVIAKAYATRKQQFRKLVESAGAKFIWGLQPAVFSKSVMSPAERAYAAAMKPFDPFAAAYKRVPYLYEKLRDLIQLPDGARLVDVHEYFKQFGESDNLFGDVMHTLPDGDEKIADCYFTHVSDMVARGA